MSQNSEKNSSWEERHMKLVEDLSSLTQAFQEHLQEVKKMGVALNAAHLDGDWEKLKEKGDKIWEQFYEEVL